MRVLSVVLVLLLFCGGCTYNHINFEPDSVRFAEKVTVEPGQGGDTTDTGATGGTTAGGQGKTSPGGSNLLDGSLQFGLLIQQGGETTPTTDANLDLTATK